MKDAEVVFFGSDQEEVSKVFFAFLTECLPSCFIFFDSPSPRSAFVPRGHM